MKFLRAKPYKAVTFLYRGINTMVLEVLAAPGAPITKESPAFRKLKFNFTYC
jgi:hypothetical protein